MESVSASDADAATSRCTLLLRGVRDDGGLGDAPEGTTSWATPAASSDDPLDVPGCFPPLLASLPDTTSDNELPRLDAAALILDMSPPRFVRAGMAMTFRISCPSFPPADTALDAAADVELTVIGVAELGVELAIARSARGVVGYG